MKKARLVTVVGVIVVVVMALTAVPFAKASSCCPDEKKESKKEVKEKPKFANVRCPIMGSPINPAKVTKNLIRDYKDQKIAFCCGGCLVTWDKLSDSEKDAKLAKVKPKPEKGHSEHKH